ncbi:hypothetical protein Pint_30938 [Pistacia integerrima]|uniref:Uncharacterized protein n=1 Tax=Pistacia integerrima TaxID=434235 RepID=A0ACC0XQU5_9ROSI|nr:hypothetical protein Pint_30938 [Pistacia integerrima]
MVVAILMLAHLGVSQQTLCGGNVSNLRKQCFVENPKLNLSRECCIAVNKFDIPCACNFVTPIVMKLFNMMNAVIVARKCGLTIQPGFKCGIQTALRAKKKYGFIDGTVKQPEDNSLELEDWWIVNSTLVSWVFNTIEPTLRSMISYMENVKDWWEDIRLKALWDELNNYDQIPVCTCIGCKCNLTTDLERKREEERVHQFLMGLDEDGFGTERVRTMTRTREERSSPMSFAVRIGARNSRGDKDKYVICSNCNREGHDADNCFQLIGYPEWWGNRTRTSVTRRGGGQKHGTSSSRNKPGISQANATQASGVYGGRGARSNSDRKGLSGLNDEQWAALLGLLSSHKNRGNERLTVRLPNGEETKALKEGTVFLGEALILRHDRTSRKLIGTGERREGVYFFKGVASAHACKTKGVGSSELWHMRMGYPSFKVLEMISKVGSLGWRLYDLENHEYLVSRDVVFVETEFPYASKHISDNDMAKNVEENWNQEVDANAQHVQDAKEDGEGNHDGEEAPIADMSAVEGNIVEENENVEEPLGRGQRVKQPSVRLRDYVTNTIKVNPSACSSLQSNSSAAKERALGSSLKSGYTVLDHPPNWKI